jgi:hypothetical protein
MIKEIVFKNPKIFQTFYKLYYYYNYFRNKHVLDRYKRLENKYQGNRCFVIGNGPSLNKQDLTKLADEYTFTCNLFYLHRQFNIIKPKFYFSIEPIKLNPFFLKKEFKELIKKLNLYAFKNNDAKFFFNTQYIDYIIKNKLFSNKNQVNYFQFFSSRFNEGKLDFTKLEMSGSAAIYFMLFMAKFLGFKKIYLIGCDYDYDNILLKTKRHFYEENLVSSPKDNKSNLILSKERYEYAKDLYIYLSKMDIIYKDFKKHDIQVFNAGIGGMTDTFPRINYNSLFKK